MCTVFKVDREKTYQMQIFMYNHPIHSTKNQIDIHEAVLEF